jgi:hypothetical protein
MCRDYTVDNFYMTLITAFVRNQDLFDVFREKKKKKGFSFLSIFHIWWLK